MLDSDVVNNIGLFVAAGVESALILSRYCTTNNLVCQMADGQLKLITDSQIYGESKYIYVNAYQWINTED